jgi:hypothetical protein
VEADIDDLAEQDAQIKRLATLCARLVLRGHVVHALSTGGFLVCWRGHSRHCSDLVSLEAFARQVGEAAIKAQGVIAEELCRAGDRDASIEAFRAVRDLINQRTPETVAQMETARGLA